MTFRFQTQVEARGKHVDPPPSSLPQLFTARTLSRLSRICGLCQAALENSLDADHLAIGNQTIPFAAPDNFAARKAAAPHNETDQVAHQIQPAEPARFMV